MKRFNISLERSTHCLSQLFLWIPEAFGLGQERLRLSQTRIKRGPFAIDHTFF
jgi:hypothetical protein